MSGWRSKVKLLLGTSKMSQARGGVGNCRQLWSGRFSKTYPFDLRNLLQGMAGVESLRDPARADLVALLSELTSREALSKIHSRMLSSKSGRKIYEERRRVSSATLAVARSCALGTFGSAYATFMDQRRFDPAHRPPAMLKSQDSIYILVRLREVHDFLHVLFDCPTTLEGELTLKAVEFANCQLPVSAIAAVVGSLQLTDQSQRRLQNILLPMAVRGGVSCEAIESIDFEAEFTTPVIELRSKYNIRPFTHIYDRSSLKTGVGSFVQYP